MKKRSFTLHIAVLALYSIIILSMLGPLNPFKQVWGGKAFDVSAHLSVRVWQTDQTSIAGLFKTKTNYWSYPDGLNLYIADRIGGTAVIPLVKLFGVAFANNALIFFNLLFGCWAMFWLIHKLQEDWGPAFLAGAIYGLSPLVLSTVYNGITESLQIGWMPLFLWTLICLFDDQKFIKDRRKVILFVTLAAVFWQLNAVGSNWYYGMFAGLLFGVTVIMYSLRPWRSQVLLRGAAVLGLFCVLISPFALIFYQSSMGVEQLSPELTTIESATIINSADPAYFFDQREPIVDGWEYYYHIAYLGFTILLFTIFGVIRSKRNQVLPWIAAALFFISIAIGPKLFYDGQLVKLADFEISTPFALFAAFAPGFEMINFPYRAFILVDMALAMAIGIGLSGLGENLSKWARTLLFMVLTALVLFETALFSGTPVPIPTRELTPRGPIKTLLNDPEQFAVFDLPIGFDTFHLTRYIDNQLFHKRPIPYNCFFVWQPLPIAIDPDNLFLYLLYRADYSHTPYFATVSTLPEKRFVKVKNDARKMLRCMPDIDSCDPELVEKIKTELARFQKQGITRFVFHQDLASEGSMVEAICRAFFGEPVTSKDKVFIFINKVLEK